MELRVVDYIANFLVKKGINHVFLVTGGGAMFLDDGVAECKDLNGICVHHEQSAAMAATSYAKNDYSTGAAILTTGCGGTNALTGVLNAYQDNIPCIFISGQTKRKETVHLSGLPLRQFGVQEADILPIVNPITKYSTMITEPDEIMYELEKAYYIANSGRPGPVWIDVPLDIQGSIVNDEKLKEFNESKYKSTELGKSTELSKNHSNDFEISIKELLNAKRPIIIVGQGVKLSKTVNQFKKLIEEFNIPYVASRLGIDTLHSEHPLFIGRIGNKGDRAGNFAVQNSDYVLVLGSRLSVSSTGHEYELFAREAKITVIDIDEFEHNKNTVKIDRFINADLREFFNYIKTNWNNKDTPISDNINKRKSWLNKCQEWKKKWSIFLPEYDDDSNGINLYKFVEILSKTLNEPATIISDAGSSFYVVSQAMQFKNDQNYITTGGQAEMGFSLPAAIGAIYSAKENNPSSSNNSNSSKSNSKKEQIIAITGDGSLQMNIQELQTLVHYKLPVKLFVWNNDGYLSIRATQKKFFENSIGTDKSNGVSFPDLKKICNAYGIKYIAMDKIDKMEEQFKEIYDTDEPIVCELFSIRDQEIIPSVSSLRKDDGTMVSKPIEDMYPFLSRGEFKKEMIINPLDE
ncbi:MAG: thiamine pyrophosphate-binding protein [Methanobacteriaceae archaeon]